MIHKIITTKQNHSVLENKIYKQNKELSISSPLSNILAETLFQKYLRKVLNIFY